MCPAPLRATDDRAEIIRIGNAVRDDQERRFPARPRNGQQIFHADIFLFGGQRDDPLMRHKARKRVQLPALGLDHRDAFGNGLSHNRDECALALAALHQQFIHGATRTQQLAHGVAPDDRAVSDRFFPGGKRLFGAGLGAGRTVGKRFAGGAFPRGRIPPVTALFFVLFSVFFPHGPKRQSAALL